jgi:lipase ATG15
MVNFVSSLESESISRVAFYRETTAFVNYLKEETEYTTVHVTGHSLGGGLALITGAQTNSSAVGLSAPNALLSRDTFDPPITKYQLDTLTFNIVPVRDVIPMFDDLANLYQNINCTAAANDFIGCHGSTRSVCEIQYTCGSGGRPVICNCAADYGYPEPIPTGTGNQTNFTQACLDAAATADNILFKGLLGVG